MSKRFSKKTRELIWKKYDYHCAYCGKYLPYKKLQIDHIHPQYLIHKYEFDDIHDLKNLNPSCARCNKWKDTMDIETFRNQIARLHEKLRRDSPQYRMVIDYNLIIENEAIVIFYYEKYNKAMGLC